MRLVDGKLFMRARGFRYNTTPVGNRDLKVI